MAGEWSTLSLREANVTLIDCEHRTPPASETGYPYVAIPQLRNGRIDLSDVRRITHEHFVEWTRKARPSANDVVLSRRCNPGETAFAPPELEFALGQNLVLLRADGTKVYPPFLRWLVRGPEWWEQIGKFLNVGAVFDSLKCADVPNFKMRIPPLAEQRAIAHILGTLDDKIELNQRMNETLEALSQTFFKDWFVDFGPTRAKAEGRLSYLAPELWSLFPDALDDGDKPVEWRGTNLAALTSKIGSGATPKGGKEVYVNEGTHFIRSQNVYDHRFIWDGLVKICSEDADRLRGVTVENDDILINITGDSILRTCIVDPGVLPARVNQHVAIIRAREDIPSRFLHLYLVQPSSKALLLGNDAGGSRAAVTKGHLEAFPVVLPTPPVLSAFREITVPWFDHMSHNEAENRTLVALRDTLLPKLISGELRLKDAEGFVGKVI